MTQYFLVSAKFIFFLFNQLLPLSVTSTTLHIISSLSCRIRLCLVTTTKTTTTVVTGARLAEGITAEAAAPVHRGRSIMRTQQTFLPPTCRLPKAAWLMIPKCPRSRLRPAHQTQTSLMTPPYRCLLPITTIGRDHSRRGYPVGALKFRDATVRALRRQIGCALVRGAPWARLSTRWKTPSALPPLASVWA